MYDRDVLRRVREKVGMVERPWGAFRRIQLYHDYANRRERYWR
jgi:hypothetical protein